MSYTPKNLLRQFNGNTRAMQEALGENLSERERLERNAQQRTVKTKQGVFKRPPLPRADKMHKFDPRGRKNF